MTEDDGQDRDERRHGASAINDQQDPNAATGMVKTVGT